MGNWEAWKNNKPQLKNAVSGSILVQMIQDAKTIRDIAQSNAAQALREAFTPSFPTNDTLKEIVHELEEGYEDVDTLTTTLNIANDIFNSKFYQTPTIKPKYKEKIVEKKQPVILEIQSTLPESEGEYTMEGAKKVFKGGS